MAACRKQISGQKQHPSPRKVHSTAKVTKKKMLEQTTLRRSSRLAKKARSTPVVFLENGLVSMERTPDHLISIAEKNTTTSRLLLLPAEIRNMIWEYATAGYTINLNKAYYEDLLGWPLEACFRLTQICRQIYAETALLGYKLSTFVVSDWSLFMKNWADRLLPVQLNAIKTIRLDEILFYEFLANPGYLPINAYFPNLKTIEVVRCYISPQTRQMGVEKLVVFEIAHSHVPFRNTARNSPWTLGELRKMGKRWALEQARISAGNSVDVILASRSWFTLKSQTKKGGY